MKTLGKKLYLKRGKYVGRVQLPGGNWTYRAIKNRDGSEITAERDARDRLILLQAEINTGEVRDSERLRDSETQRVDPLLAGYAQAGFPTKRYQRVRESVDLRTSFDHLQRFFGGLIPENIGLPECDDYVVYRKRVAAENGRGTGDRVAEIDLQNMSSAFNWAVRKRKLKKNPIRERERYQDPATVVHCTAHMPMTAEALHDIAAELSPVLRHQCLLEAFTGGRTGEILKLKADPEINTPGFYNDDYLWIDRSKGGINPYVVMHEPLNCLLLHAKAYRDKHHPHSAYLLPGKNGISSVHGDSLTQALRGACKRAGHPKVISHGLRAFYVRCLRSKGLSDTEIAIRLGHRSGVRLIESTYGLPEPRWIGENKLDFMPKDQPAAWERD
jgi:integrase